MASSDEEGEILPERVTSYQFADQTNAPVSFSILPLLWQDGQILGDFQTQICLRGSCDNGLQPIYKHVMAWKLELSYVHPEISVLSKDRNWIILQRPLKSFENIIRTILIAVHCLHFLKRNPEASGESLWNHLLKAFSSYEVEPSENDLRVHMSLLKEASERDKDLAKSEYLRTLMGNHKPSVALHEDVRTTKKFKFIVEEDEYCGDEEDDGEQAESPFDPVCAICDNGGQVLCCEGTCLRSFHATTTAGIDTMCESLGYADDAQVEAISTFLCKNCQYKRHQCFVCGRLGSSDTSSGQEVFPCISAACGHFYHPECVAKLLHSENETQAENLREKIAAGESFTCPVHKCYFCKQNEVKDVYDLQFALCRRCPKAYHRKCLPRKIRFEFNTDENIMQRAWDGLLPHNRILIYCLKHQIVRELGTPPRDHLIFPGVVRERRNQISDLRLKVKFEATKRNMIPENSAADRTSVKKRKNVEAMADVFVENRSENDFEPLKKPNVSGLGRTSLKDSIVAVPYQSFTANKSKISLRNSDSSVNLITSSDRCKEQNQCGHKIKITGPSKPMMEKANSLRTVVDAQMEKRILALMKSCTSSFDIDEFKNRQGMPATYAHSSGNMLDRAITQGLVEGSVKAVRTALQKLEEGCSIEDAKTVCEPEILKQIIQWKRKLNVYLAPFLHGMCYSSFGRHFTKVEKLKEVVNRLHWYVQSGDTIVDFCCGSNDFSCLMKEKLEKTGKSCSFKNYDLVPCKNDFNFERRDWLGVANNELADGSQLIMGLNPPFGFKGSLANQFIYKALQFRPKLIVLIVPKETKRLDEKAAYDLLWEDDKLLSGKSFYLPGSVDVNDKQLDQWNVKAPPLFLWSCSDWTAQHKAIAQEHGHICKDKEMHMEENAKTVVPNYLMDENYDCYGDFSSVAHACGDLSSILDDVPECTDDIQPEGKGARGQTQTKEIWESISNFSGTKWTVLYLEGALFPDSEFHQLVFEEQMAGFPLANLERPFGSAALVLD